MSKDSEHELIARAVVVVSRQVLLCRRRGTQRSYLPGGHVEPGESIPEALRREVREELGREADRMDFLGIAEHRFESAGEIVCEVNILYVTHVPGLDPVHGAPRSAEPHLEFFWHPLKSLAAAAFEPFALCALLPHWCAAPALAATRFASNFAPGPVTDKGRDQGMG